MLAMHHILALSDCCSHVPPFALQGMPQLRDAFASSVLYCGGYKAQHIVTLLHGQRRLEGAVEVRRGAEDCGMIQGVGMARITASMRERVRWAGIGTVLPNSPMLAPGMTGGIQRAAVLLPLSTSSFIDCLTATHPLRRSPPAFSWAPTRRQLRK